MSPTVDTTRAGKTRRLLPRRAADSLEQWAAHGVPVDPSACAIAGDDIGLLLDRLHVWSDLCDHLCDLLDSTDVADHAREMHSQAALFD